MGQNLEPKEIFEKIVLPEDLEYVIKAIKNVNYQNYGYECGDITTCCLDDGRIKVSVPLIKCENKVK